MESLQEIVADKLINNYPLDIVEKLVKKGQERIKKENEREVVITYNYNIYKYHTEKQLLLDYLDFLIRMKLPYDSDIKSYWRAQLILLLNQLDINEENSLTDLFKLIRERLIEPDSPIDDAYHAFRNFHYQDPAFKKEASSKILKLLEKYGEYRKYFTIAKCHKNDYVVIYFNEDGYGRHLIGSNLDHMNIETGGGQYVYTVYQVD